VILFFQTIDKERYLILRKEHEKTWTQQEQERENQNYGLISLILEYNVKKGLTSHKNLSTYVHMWTS